MRSGSTQIGRGRTDIKSIAANFARTTSEEFSFPSICAAFDVGTRIDDGLMSYFALCFGSVLSSKSKGDAIKIEL